MKIFYHQKTHPHVTALPNNLLGLNVQSFRVTHFAYKFKTVRVFMHAQKFVLTLNGNVKAFEVAEGDYTNEGWATAFFDSLTDASAGSAITKDLTYLEETQQFEWNFVSNGQTAVIKVNPFQSAAYSQELTDLVGYPYATSDWLIASTTQPNIVDIWNPSKLGTLHDHVLLKCDELDRCTQSVVDGNYVSSVIASIPCLNTEDDQWLYCDMHHVDFSAPVQTYNVNKMRFYLTDIQDRPLENAVFSLSVEII